MKSISFIITREQRGITLITLVVTIIVLIILAGVSIAMLVGENGIITQAQRAKENTELAEKQEKEDMGELEDLIDRYANGNKSLSVVTGNETTNTIVYDKYGNKVVVPAGFKIINPDDDVTKGIIIEDVSAGNTISKGNQFVWIPVGNIYTDLDGNSTNITLGRYAFNSEGKSKLMQTGNEYQDKILISENFLELVNNEYGNTLAKDLKDFVIKTQENKGYYISRYEIGDNMAIDNERTQSSGIGNIPISKAGVYPYNYVRQAQAATLSQTMYDNSNFETDLINSYAWDTAIEFIQNFSGDIDYSQQTSLEQNMILKTGALKNTTSNDNDERCNIYDMAGNVSEWTTETYVNEENPCTHRGGW